MPRYKIAIKVVLGEIKGEGVRVTSKCLWDVQFDNYASYSYANVILYIKYKGKTILCGNRLWMLF